MDVCEGGKKNLNCKGSPCVCQVVVAAAGLFGMPKFLFRGRQREKWGSKSLRGRYTRAHTFADDASQTASLANFQGTHMIVTNSYAVHPTSTST